MYKVCILLVLVTQIFVYLAHFPSDPCQSIAELAVFSRKLLRWWRVIAVHEVCILFCSHRHSTVHLMQKPHQCPHCPFAARMASHLRRHLRLHTGAKPYRCPYCSYTCNILVSTRSFAVNTRNNFQI